MKKITYWSVLGLMGCVLFGGDAYAQFGKRRGNQRAKAAVSLVASVEAVVPGQPFEVGIRFKLSPGWHIYWQHSGDSGIPPTVDWKLTHGFSAGSIRFPFPERSIAAGEIVTNVLEGEPVLLVTITPPDAISEDRVTIAARVTHLACKTQCVREQNEVSLQLPVGPVNAPATPANGKLFEEAHRRLPKKTSPRITITPSASVAKLVSGQTFDLNVQINVASGLVLPAREGKSGKIVGLDVYVNRVEGVYYERAVFGKPTPRTIEGQGSIPVFSGQTVVRIPGEVEEEIASGPVTLAGLVRFQACEESGKCFEPEAVTFSLTVGDTISPKVGTAVDKPDADSAAAATTPVPANDSNGKSEAAPTPTADTAMSWINRWGLGGLLLACFLYGLSINATPCVLPLLSIKVLGFVQQAHESRRRTLLLGLSFGGGVLVFFVILGLLASAGKNILQFPVAIIVLGGVVMSLALSMLGVFTLQVPTTAATLEAKIQKEGMISSFGKGALAPVLGLACTGPFLAAAFGWATQQPKDIAILAFLASGLGMASPYMVLGANPNWLSFLPKPGNWMITFERIMGFLLLGMVLWLISPLVAQIGADGLQWTLVFFVALAMACWVLGKVQITMPESVRWQYRGTAGAIVVCSAFLVFGWVYPIGEAIEREKDLRMAGSAPAQDWARGIPWRRWSPEAIEKTVLAGQPVFVDFTAAWCTVCKANKKLATNTKDVRAKMKSCGVIPFQADFTSDDPVIADALHRFNRAGPPLNLIYGPGQPESPIVLSTNLTKTYLLDMLDKVCESRTASASPVG
ncbi:MAG: thioredoxin family protein [Planctomycetes bacterium]|nr:thioredoxin family protein [Planctomycetota bacterium]